MGTFSLSLKLGTETFGTETFDQYYTLSLPYTSHRCANVASNLTRLLKTHTPNYHVNIAWRSEKLQKYFSHKLKLPVPDFAKIQLTSMIVSVKTHT